jgi:hypothetical protein
MIMILLLMVVGCSESDIPIQKSEAEKQESTETADKIN